MRTKLPIVLTLLLPGCLYISLEEHEDRQDQLGDTDDTDTTDTDTTIDVDPALRLDSVEGSLDACDPASQPTVFGGVVPDTLTGPQTVTLSLDGGTEWVQQLDLPQTGGFELELAPTVGATDDCPTDGSDCELELRLPGMGPGRVADIDVPVLPDTTPTLVTALVNGVDLGVGGGASTGSLVVELGDARVSDAADGTYVLRVCDDTEGLTGSACVGLTPTVDADDGTVTLTVPVSGIAAVSCDGVPTTVSLSVEVTDHPCAGTFEIPLATSTSGWADDCDDDGSVGDDDCDDLDASRYPFADEVCGDGIDQDCLGGDALVVDTDTVGAAGPGYATPAAAISGGATTMEICGDVTGGVDLQTPGDYTFIGSGTPMPVWTATSERHIIADGSPGLDNGFGVFIEGLVLDGGSAGGGIRAEHTRLTLTNSSVQFVNRSGGDGNGAVNLIASTLTLESSSIHDNESMEGGGAWMQATTATVDEMSSIQNNTAQVGAGAMLINSGILLYGTITGNTADAEGGGVMLRGDAGGGAADVVPHVIRRPQGSKLESIGAITANTAPKGAGVSLDGGMPTIAYLTAHVSGNATTALYIPDTSSLTLGDSVSIQGEANVDAGGSLDTCGPVIPPLPLFHYDNAEVNMPPEPPDCWALASPDWALIPCACPVLDPGQ